MPTPPPPTFSPADHAAMRRALSLARRAQGHVEPNPMVGAVVTQNGRIIAEAYHHRFGGPHAEALALHFALAKLRVRKSAKTARDLTLYVTLEPCCHWGKTPPCTDAILAAGISRVVIAMIDPFPQVHGQGAALLRQHGLRVDVGLLESEARILNAPFITRITQARPFVTAKWAQSLDGCIATAAGESRWISSEASREIVQKIRGRMDGILIGIGTALQDDPLLMARPKTGRDIRRLATRIILDTHCRLPPDSQLVRTISSAPVLLAHSAKLAGAAKKRAHVLAARGVMMLPLPLDRAGHIRIDALLKHLGKLDYTNLLVEGGGETLAAFFHANLIDAAHIFIAPTIIGGPNARHAIAGNDLQKLAAAKKLSFVSATPSGPDMHLVLQRPDH